MDANKPPADEQQAPPIAPELEVETDFEDEDLPLGFNQTRLPWFLAGGMLLLYLASLNRWLRPENLGEVAHALGWDWLPDLKAPLLVLLTQPLRWLPSGWQPVGLSAFSAVLASLNVALLARCVALLPYDRTREARQRERSDFALLSNRWSWVAPVFGALTLGLSLTFWEHATAFSAEMLDLLLFGWVVHSLLSYRLSEQEGTLYQAAFVYGLAVTNNYAMIAFLPCFLVALLWIRGFAFFRLGFLGRMLGLGMAGALLYLLLPALETGRTGIGFMELLRATLAGQKSALLSFPPWILLILSFTTFLPVLLIGVRWPVNVGDTSEAGAVAMTFFMRLTHAVMLVAPLSVLLGAMWGPRELGMGRALLPLHFLAALAVGYYSGYLLLVFGSTGKRSRHRGGANTSLLGGLITVLVLAAAVAAPGFLLVRHYPDIRERDGRLFSRFASFAVRHLPADQGYLLSDNRFDLLLAEAALRREGRGGRHVLMLSSTLPYPTYHEQMARRFPGRWPSISDDGGADSVYRKTRLAGYIAGIVASNQVHYLHPSAGYYFEQVALAPRGLTFEVTLRPADVTREPVPSSGELDANEAFWDEVTTALPLGAEQEGELAEIDYARRMLARGLNYWGVTLQRQGRLEAAARRFQQVLNLEPENVSARSNAEFNRALVAGSLPALELTRPLSPAEKALTWWHLVSVYGPPDDGIWTFRLGRMLADQSYFRQALPELRRVHELYPEDPRADIWHRSIEALSWVGEGELDRALTVASAVVQDHPDSGTALSTLTQVHLYRRDSTNALATLARQLQVNPDDPSALLNDGALRIQASDFTGAIASMDRLLALQPDNAPARLNRAIARLQTDRLDAAREDYALLLNNEAEFYAVHYGLGEIAWRQQRKTAALEHYRRYLELAQAGSQEYQEVERRVTELERAGAQP